MELTEQKTPQRRYTLDELCDAVGAAQRWTERVQKCGWKHTYNQISVNNALMGPTKGNHYRRNRLTSVPQERLPEGMHYGRPQWFLKSEVDAVYLRPEHGRRKQTTYVKHICPRCKREFECPDEFPDWYWCVSCRRNYQSAWATWYDDHMDNPPRPEYHYNWRSNRAKNRADGTTV